MSAAGIARNVARRFGVDLVRHRKAPLDFRPDDVALLDRVRPFTMTSPERVYAAASAARYVAEAKIPGAIVECGVWRGGSSMAMALALLAAGVDDRDLYLFDTYEGMTAPTAEDKDFRGESAQVKFEQTKTSDDASDWCATGIDDVRTNVTSTGYPIERLHLVQGKVEETLPADAPDEIAVLRLDTDWYTSTKHELVHLWPRLVTGGVCIIDDYGHWEGCRQAVDEYFAEQGITVLMNRVDVTGRTIVKP